jgi:hypothetical protein
LLLRFCRLSFRKRREKREEKRGRKRERKREEKRGKEKRGEEKKGKSFFSFPRRFFVLPFFFWFISFAKRTKTRSKKIQEGGSEKSNKRRLRAVGEHAVGACVRCAPRPAGLRRRGERAEPGVPLHDAAN